MREILFRGKRLKEPVWDEEPWVYGSLIDSGNHEQVAIYPWLDCASTMSVRQLVYNRMVGVDYRTVGQYTGLKDRNGVRIFEGDIVEHHVQGDILVNRGVIQWDERCARWSHRLNTMNPDLALFNPEAWEVIGNIHDNPELLEGGTACEK